MSVKNLEIYSEDDNNSKGLQGVIDAFAKESNSAKFSRVNALQAVDFCKSQRVNIVPTVIVYKCDNELKRLEGCKVPELNEMLKKFLHHKNNEQGQHFDVLNDKLKYLINLSQVMVFMKGSPDAPRCGFSKTLVGIFAEHQIKFGYFDILGDNEVRQGLKEYSSWPTYPQIYAKGELIGGLDIIKELVDEGELKEALHM